MNKKYLLLFFIIIISNVYSSTYIDEYLFLTIKGNIDKYPITMHIKIKNPKYILEEKTANIKGHYKYDDINTPIKLEGSINNKSMTIRANNNEIFAFSLNENQLYNILNSKNKININLNGKWRDNNNYFECSIKTIDFVHYIHEIHIENKYDENEGSIGGLYIEDKSLAIYNKYESSNISIDQLISNMNNSLNETLKSENYISNLNYSEYYSISDYFDDKIFYIIYSKYSEEKDIVYAFSIYTLKKINNSLSDLVNDTKDFRNFLKNKIKKEINNYQYFDDNTEIYFNTDGSININFFFKDDKLEYKLININELKPYIKSDSFYIYMFENYNKK